MVNNSDSIFDTVEHEIDPEEDYCWLDFKKGFDHGTIYNNESEMVFSVSGKIKKVLVIIPVGKGFFIKKDNCKEYLYNVVSSIENDSSEPPLLFFKHAFFLVLSDEKT